MLWAFVVQNFCKNLFSGGKSRKNGIPVIKITFSLQKIPKEYRFPWVSVILIHIKASFVLYTVIHGYFNELIYEIMKWNTSKIKHHNYEVLLNLQVQLIVLVLTHGNLYSWEIFAKKRWFLLQECHFFYFFLLPENDFLQKFWTTNAHNNEEFTIKHQEKKITSGLWKVFLDSFASVSPGTMVILT